MSQRKSVQADRHLSGDTNAHAIEIDEIVQAIATIAKFRGVRFEADERKVKLYRSGSSNNAGGAPENDKVA